MRKTHWTVPLVASLSVASIITPVLATTQYVQAASRVVHDESAEWLKIDRAHKTVTVKVVAGETTDNSGMNFDGYSKGNMQIKVPQGWLVRVSFQNHGSMMPHSAMIVPFAQHVKVSGFTAAFPGSYTPSPTTGTMAGVTQSFKFKANKSGSFALICALPGHSAGGMWDKFTVSSQIKTPSVLVSEEDSGGGSGGGY